MTTEKFDTWEQAAQVLQHMKIHHTFGTLETWALDYAIRCVKRDKERQGGLTRTEQILKETEMALSGDFAVYRDEGRMDLEERR